MPAHKQQSDDEHELMFEALRSGKIEEAVRILETHLLQTGNLLANYLTRQLAKHAARNLKGKAAKSAAA
jgi:DNA-binding GntR family transcriptional regulator